MKLQVALCLFTITASAQSDLTPTDFVVPRIAPQAMSIQGFVPKDWRLEQSLMVDLNGDSRRDAFLMLRQAQPRLIIKNPFRNGIDENLNPRLLAVAFANPTEGFTLQATNHKLIPLRENEYYTDPFNDLQVSSNKIRIKIEQFVGSGSLTWTTSFLFRYQNGCVRLIGYDRKEFLRNSGDSYDLSVNYLTAQIKETQTPPTARAVIKWSNLRSNRIVCLESIGDGFNFDPKLGQR